MDPNITERYINSRNGELNRFIGHERAFIEHICLESRFEEFSDFLDLAIFHFREPNNTVADVIDENSAILLSQRTITELGKLSKEEQDEDAVAIKHTLIFALNYFERRELFPTLWGLYLAEADKRCKAELFNRLVSCANGDDEEIEAAFIEELQSLIESGIYNIEKVGYTLLKLKNYKAATTLLSKIIEDERYSLDVKISIYHSGIYSHYNLPLKDYLIKSIPKLPNNNKDKASKNSFNSLDIIYKSRFYPQELINEVEQLEGYEQELLILKIYDLMISVDIPEIKNVVYTCICKNILHARSKIELFERIKSKKKPKKEYQTWLIDIINWMKSDLISGQLIFAYKRYTENFIPEAENKLQKLISEPEEDYIYRGTWEDKWRKECSRV